MKSNALLLAVLPALLLASLALGETYVVRPDGTGDFPTVQAAVAAVVDGDIIELTDGTFTGDGNRDIDFLGKAITVRSQSGDAASCVIDCEGTEAISRRGFIFSSGEGAGSVLDGVTVTNGYYFDRAGGIFCGLPASSPTIMNCIICGNTAGGGGGVSLLASSPTFINCTFCHNTASWPGGGGLWCDADNDLNPSSPRLVNCTFADNTAPDGAAICCTFSFPDLENSILAFNGDGPAISCLFAPPSNPDLVCCDVYGNIGGDWVDCIADEVGLNGNFSEDPLFCRDEYPQRPYGIREDSPCAPENNPGCGLVGAWPVGCEPPTAVEEATWGRMKAMYRQ